MQVNVGDARDLGDHAAQLLRDRQIGGLVHANDLDIDRRGQTEIENLIGDVRRLEEEHHVGKRSGESLAEPDLMLTDRPVPLAIQ